MKRNKNIVFQTKKERSSGQMKKFAAVLLVFVVVFGSFSIIYLMKYYNFDMGKVLGEKETTTGETDAAETPAEKHASATYLFYSASSNKNRLNFVIAVRFSVPAGTVEICPIDSLAPVDCNGSSSNLARIFATGSKKDFIAACSTLCAADIDRYIGSTDETFRQIVYSVGYSGGFNVNVADQIEYRGNDYNLILTKGSQSLKGDSLLRYMRYLYSAEQGGKQGLSDAFGSILAQIFANESAESAPNIYAALVNTLDTNVSRFDYSAALAAMDMFFDGKAKYSYCESLK